MDAIQNGQIIFKMQAQFARPESERAWWVGGKGEQRSAGQPLVSVGGGGSGDDDAGWLVELWRTRESLHSNKIGCIHSPIAANELAKLLKGRTTGGSSNLFGRRWRLERKGGLAPIRDSRQAEVSPDAEALVAKQAGS